MKKIVMSMLVFSVFTFGTALASPASPVVNTSVQSCNIGFIDVNKVMAESPKVKMFQEQLNQLGKELIDQLEAEKANLSSEDFSKKQKEVYAEFMKVKQEKESQIDASIKLAIEKVSKKKNLTIVVYKNSIAAGGIDITSDVMNNIE